VIRTRVVVRDEALRAAMTETRAQLDEDVRSALIGVAEDVVLPVTRTLAPRRSGELVSSLVARATQRGAYITSSIRGKRGRRVGLLEFGGTVKKPIVPRRARALTPAPGVFVARITTHRTYPAQMFMQRSVAVQQSRIRAAIGDALTEAVNRHMRRHGVG
jgi:hypothetical protein